ncbi:hypothetical protein [Roseisolibacter agri]|uniref:Lipoprotein n=1 Tax=Roseisolibacter agri TaxID=2014610 RepID=A0AA37Q161_9BACT|nr:hypothetical protein [Roseisolibacter agri]GLC24695.1 hypothetical protein rosag_12080 [Roseisolibacter agri]
MRAPTVLACGALLAGAASTARAQGCSYPAPPEDARGAARAGLPADVSWPPWFYARADRVARLARLTPLDRRVLPDGVREVRIWLVGPGITSHMIRFTEQGGRTRGEVVIHWEVTPVDSACGEPAGESMHDLMLYTLPGQCGPIASGVDVAACRARFARAPDWRATLQALAADGLWELPDQSTLPPRNFVVFDGWGMVVELRDGARYRAYEFNNPGMGQSLPEQRAARMGERFRALLALLREPDVVRDYRGIYTGPVGPRARLDLDSTASFRACGGAETWGVSGWVPSLTALHDVPVTDSGVPVRRLYVEGRGELTPAWLARRWESRFARVLQLREMRVARPWTAAGCPPR